MGPSRRREPEYEDMSPFIPQKRQVAQEQAEDQFTTEHSLGKPDANRALQHLLRASPSPITSTRTLHLPAHPSLPLQYAMLPPKPSSHRSHRLPHRGDFAPNFCPFTPRTERQGRGSSPNGPSRSNGSPAIIATGLLTATLVELLNLRADPWWCEEEERAKLVGRVHCDAPPDPKKGQDRTAFTDWETFKQDHPHTWEAELANISVLAQKNGMVLAGARFALVQAAPHNCHRPSSVPVSVNTFDPRVHWTLVFLNIKGELIKWNFRNHEGKNTTDAVVHYPSLGHGNGCTFRYDGVASSCHGDLNRIDLAPIWGNPAVSAEHHGDDPRTLDDLVAAQRLRHNANKAAEAANPKPTPEQKAANDATKAAASKAKHEANLQIGRDHRSKEREAGKPKQ